MSKREGEKIFSMRLDKDFHKKLKFLAVERETTIKALFMECMEKLLAEDERQRADKK